MWRPNVSLASGNAQGAWNDVGSKFFELSNHLGNVMAVITDKRIALEGGGYEAEIINATDYYAFGSPMPRRNVNFGNYRYGFNGKENDNEVKGEGNQQDYGMRIYDPRIGRFLSVDPISSDYPELTPYQFASNRPIDGTDLDGLEYNPMIMSKDVVLTVELAKEKDINKQKDLITTHHKINVGTAKIGAAVMYIALLRKFPNMAATGFVGSLFNGLYSLADNKSPYEVRRSFISGFISSSIVGLGKNSFLNNIITGAASGGVGELVDQVIDNEFGIAEGFDQSKIVQGTAIGAISGPFAGFSTDGIARIFNRLTNEMIKKTESKVYRKVITDAIKKENPRFGNRQIRNAVNKQIKGIQESAKKELAALRAAALKTMEAGVKHGEEKTKKKINEE